MHPVQTSTLVTSGISSATVQEDGSYLVDSLSAEQMAAVFDEMSNHSRVHGDWNVELSISATSDGLIFSDNGETVDVKLRYFEVSELAIEK